MAESMQNTQDPYYTLAEGVPLPRNDTTNQILTGSGGGFVLLTSTQLIENLAHFSRERIPERTVHAKASAAWGYYEVTDDVSDLTDADFLKGIGKKTEVLTRISTVGPERGSADTVRDFRGFAVKFKTAQGNNDWVFNNQPVFFIRDPVKFPSMNRSHKRHPGTNASNADMFWDFHVNNQESIHALMFLFGDRGLPSSVRHTNGYSGNTYKFTKSNGLYHYVRIHFISDQGTHHLSNSDAARLAGYDPDNHVLDLQSSIESGNFPSWTVYFQAIHPSKIVNSPVPIFDMTKVWPHKLYPLRRAGRMVLNRNPTNWFAEIEQAAFSPSNMVPGIEPSPDPMLQARMFAYPDAARYRLGVNYQFLPTNAPKAPVYCPIERDGFMNFTKNYGTDPNYIGTQLKPVKFLDVMNQGQEHEHKEADRETSTTDITAPAALDVASSKTPLPMVISTNVTDRDFEQATALWCNVMQKQDGAQVRFVENVSAHAAGVKDDKLRGKIYAMFGNVDTTLSDKIRQTTETKIEGSHLHPHKTAWH